MTFKEKDITYASALDVTGFAAGSGDLAKNGSVYAGSVGTTTYTAGDIITALKIIGVLIP